MATMRCATIPEGQIQGERYIDTYYNYSLKVPKGWYACKPQSATDARASLCKGTPVADRYIAVYVNKLLKARDSSEEYYRAVYVRTIKPRRGISARYATTIKPRSEDHYENAIGVLRQNLAAVCKELDVCRYSVDENGDFEVQTSTTQSAGRLCRDGRTFYAIELVSNSEPSDEEILNEMRASMKCGKP